MLPDGWKSFRLDELSDVVRGASPRPAGDPRYFDGNFLPWITVSDVTANSRMYLDSTKSGLTREGAEHTRIVEPMTLVLSNSGATLGVPKIIRMRAGANDGIAMLLNLRGVLQEYVYYLLQGQTTFLREVVAPGNGQPNLNTELIGAIQVLIPPMAEQIEIARVLAKWDEAIATTERLLANSREHKLAISDQLLCGRRQLREFAIGSLRRATPCGPIPNSWSCLKIEEIADQISQKHKTGEALPVLSCTKHLGLVDSLSYFKKQVFSKDLSTYKIVPRGTFAYATNHIEEGSIGYQNLYDFALVSPMYTVFRTNERVDDDFLYRLLKSERFRQIFEAATSSSVDRRGSLRWNDFKLLHIPLPPMKEQRAISQVLASADEEIGLRIRQIEALRAEKSALMQQLLTGKRRLQLPPLADQQPATNNQQPQ